MHDDRKGCVAITAMEPGRWATAPALGARVSVGLGA